MKKKEYSRPASKIVSIQPMVMIAASPPVDPGTHTGDSFARELDVWDEDENFCSEPFNY